MKIIKLNSLTHKTSMPSRIQKIITNLNESNSPLEIKESFLKCNNDRYTELLDILPLLKIMAKNAKIIIGQKLSNPTVKVAGLGPKRIRLRPFVNKEMVTPQQDILDVASRLKDLLVTYQKTLDAITKLNKSNGHLKIKKSFIYCDSSRWEELLEIIPSLKKMAKGVRITIGQRLSNPTVKINTIKAQRMCLRPIFNKQTVTPYENIMDVTTELKTMFLQNQKVLRRKNKTASNTDRHLKLVYSANRKKN